MPTDYIEVRDAGSIRIDAVLKLVCASTTHTGRVCGQGGRYEASEPEEAIAAARQDGWTFRKEYARCPRCGREGASLRTGRK